MAKNRKKTGASKIHRELHKRIKRYCKTEGHEWEVRSTRNGYAYYLDGERIYSTHPSNYLSPDLRQAFIRAGIPREVIGLEITVEQLFAGTIVNNVPQWKNREDLENGDVERCESVSDDLDNAQVGDLVWLDGHNVLITKRIEHPELQDICCFCDEGYILHEMEKTACFSCQPLKAYIEFQPNGSTKQYAHDVAKIEE
jgi:hypothetical protein